MTVASPSVVILLEPTLSASPSPLQEACPPSLDSKPSKDRTTWGIVASSLGRVFRNDWAVCCPSPPAGAALQPHPGINDVELVPSTVQASDALSAEQWNALAAHAVGVYQPKHIVLLRQGYTCDPKHLVDAVKGSLYVL